MKHDWKAIRAEYVAGGGSLRALAEKHGVSLALIGTRSAREGWQEDREAETERVRRMAMSATRARRVKREAASLEKVEGQTERIIDMISTALEDPTQLYRHLVYIGKGAQEEQILGKLDTRAARDYVGMLHELKAMLDEYGNNMDKRTTEDLKLKRARLKLDTRKAGLNEVSQGESGVILMPPLDTGSTVTVEVGDNGSE